MIIVINYNTLYLNIKYHLTLGRVKHLMLSVIETVLFRAIAGKSMRNKLIVFDVMRVICINAVLNIHSNTLLPTTYTLIC